MKLEDQALLSFYQELTPLSNNPHVMLVSHIETNQLYVKKTLSLENANIYKLLKAYPVSGTPRVILMAETEKELIVIEEYISGSTLNLLLRQNGVFTEKAAVQITLQLCRILNQLHDQPRRIIHRDIKPSNVIIGSSQTVWLVDFDASKRYSESSTRDTTLLGTVEYAAPEQYGFAQSDARTDIYGLGILLNIMLTGQFPVKLPAKGAVGQIIQKCTQIDPAARYQSVDSLEKALRQIRPGEFNKALESSRKSKNPRENLARKADQPKKSAAYRHPLAPPGFRSMKIWKMILAVLGYASLIWLSATIDAEGATITATILIYRITTFLILISWALIFANYGGVCHHLLLARSSNLPVSLIGRALWCLLVMATFMVIMGIITGIFDPAFVQVD